MLFFGKGSFQPCLDILKEIEEQLVGLGGSDEQRIYVYEIIVYCCIKVQDFDYGRKIVEKYFLKGYTNACLNKLE